MRRAFLLIALVAALGALAMPAVAAEPLTFHHIKIRRHRSSENRVMVDKVGVLSFDDEHRRLTFRSSPGDKFEVQDKLDVGYDDIAKVVFEVTTHMRGGGWAQVIQAASIPGVIVGSAMAGQHVHDYWFYLEYKNGDQSEQALLEVPKDSSQKVIEEAQNLFGTKVTISEFLEKPEEINPEQLADYKTKDSLRIDKQDRPAPEARADKAMIVVVCPPLAARDSGKGNQFKLHANDKIVAVNRAGTYSFAYLDPGKYRLVSQSENANGFEMELEAGKTYYFLQNTFQGAFRWRTMLSRNSPELVTYLMSGTYFSEWEPK